MKFYAHFFLFHSLKHRIRIASMCNNENNYNLKQKILKKIEQFISLIKHIYFTHYL